MTLSYVQAIVIGLLQGVSELFPASSLGYSVLIPALLGWHNLVHGQSAGNPSTSPSSSDCMSPRRGR